MAPRRTKKEGFSLVETAMALLVISVGMLAVLGIFPAGLEANKKSIDDSNYGLFADYVMNGIRALSETVPWSEVRENNPNFRLKAPTYDPVVGGMWYQQGNLDVIPTDTGGAGIQVSYKVYSDPNIEELAFKYELRIISDPGHPYRKSVELEVWTGYGSKTDSVKFYSELYRYE